MVLSMEDRQSELLQAIRSLDYDGVRRMLDRHHQNPRMVSVDVNQALLAAVKTAHSDIVKLLLRQKSANVMFRDDLQRSSIHYAAEGASPVVLEQVIRAGSVVSLTDKDGFTALHLAARSGNVAMIDILLRHGARVRKPESYVYGCGESPLHLAAKSGKASAVRILVLKGAAIDRESTEDRSTALHKALAGRHDEIVTFLVKAGANVNKQDFQGRTALHLVAKNGMQEACQLLLDCGAKVRIRDHKSRTPLHTAIATRQPRITELLLQADHTVIALKDGDGLTALHYASISGLVDDVVALLNAGAELDVVDQREQVTPLIMAIANNQLDIARVLVYSGAAVNLADHAESTPLHRLQASRDADKSEMADLLIEYGAKLNPMTSQGYTPLDRCVFQYLLGNYSRSMLKLLVVNGAYLRPLEGPRGIHRNSPLCWLVWRGDLESARYLVRVGWDIQQENWIHLPGKTNKQSDFLSWLQEQARQPCGLAHLCRAAIRNHLITVSEDTEITSFVEPLPLPKNIKKYLLFHDESEDLLEQAT